MKKLIILLAIAITLLGVALWIRSNSTKKAPDVIGKKILPEFNISDVTEITISNEAHVVTLRSGQAGWTVENLHDYPANDKQIASEILKLTELKVGQTADGVTNTATVVVAFKNASGKELAKVEMGKQHTSGEPGDPMNPPDGRFISFNGMMVLVDDPLDAFDRAPKEWADTRINVVSNSSDVTAVTYTKGKETVKLTRKDSTWTLEGLGPKEELDTSKTYLFNSALTGLRFSDIVDPKKTEAELGFATGTVYTATLKDGIIYTAKVGNKIGADYAFKVSASFNVGTNASEKTAGEAKVKEFNDTVGKWTYVISSYSAESMYKARKDLVKAKEEPKKEEAKKPESTSVEKKTAPAVNPAPAAQPAPAPAQAKKPEPKKIETKPVGKKVESKTAPKPESKTAPKK